GKGIRGRRHLLSDEPRPSSTLRRRGRIKPRGYAAREQEPCRGGPLALQVHDQRRAEFVAGLEVSHNALRDEDPPGLTVRLQAAREVDRVPPQVVGEFSLADGPCYRGTRGDAHANQDRIPRRPSSALELL